ncbi:Cytochrome c oxidase subunit 4 [Roseovarius sp. EC-HK134]|jgi:hypothetical protein|uniref:Cytochrome c oxidase subunit 4 n=1 Tax=Roseovarius mucosus TaxID=215743 RepID=A0A1V0RKN4_9RHOB|nr:cytochrome c oxidase subunit 4 [Roseovarius mucosus]VVT32535.1 Cytochrome c oxidase subunit 4 [Roseovarius sp. EC-HK134]VVT32766.1 Cytochrome c oxidase subunit 4 [Roseovarius sp. EC-SD190]|tara:strand:- start:25 stop:213 length:189 start_codon:yes stop_codon:yes gene_type:complete
MGYPTAEFERKSARDTQNMAEHKHGEMNIDVQEKTFDGFIKWVTYVAIACIVLLLFIAAVNG